MLSSYITRQRWRSSSDLFRSQTAYLFFPIIHGTSREHARDFFHLFWFMFWQMCHWKACTGYSISSPWVRERKQGTCPQKSACTKQGPAEMQACFAANTIRFWWRNQAQIAVQLLRRFGSNGWWMNSIDMQANINCHSLTLSDIWGSWRTRNLLHFKPFQEVLIDGSHSSVRLGPLSVSRCDCLRRKIPVVRTLLTPGHAQRGIDYKAFGVLPVIWPRKHHLRDLLTVQVKVFASYLKTQSILFGSKNKKLLYKGAIISYYTYRVVLHTSYKTNVF